MRPFSVALVLTSGQLASCDVTASINSAVAAVKLESKNFCVSRSLSSFRQTVLTTLSAKLFHSLSDPRFPIPIARPMTFRYLAISPSKNLPLFQDV